MNARDGIRNSVMRSRLLRGRLTGLGDDTSGDGGYGDFLLSPEGAVTGYGSNSGLFDASDLLGSSTPAFTPSPSITAYTPITVPLQADTTPLPTVTLENVLGSANVSAPDAYGNQMFGIANPDGSTTISGVTNSITGQTYNVNPSSSQSIETQLANAVGNLSKTAAQILGGTSAQIAAAAKPAGSQSGISQWLSGSTAEYVVFGGIGLILVVAMSKRR